MKTPLRQLYLRRLLARALQYKWLLAISVCAGAVNLGLTFVFPWLIGAAIDKVIAPDWVRRGMPSPPTYEERMSWLWMLIAMGAGTAVMFGVITYTRGHYTVKLGNRIIADLRRDLFDHLQRLSLHFYSKENTGSIVARLINDIQEAGNLINGGVLLVVMDLAQTVVGLFLLFDISWKLTLACITILPLYVITFKLFNHRVRVAADRVQSQISRMSGTLQERLSGIALVKTNDGEDRERRHFADQTEEHFGRVVQQSSVAHFAGAISETLIHTGTVIVVGYGSYLALVRDGGMSAGDMTRFLGFLGVMYGPVRRLAELNIMYQNSMVSLDRVFRVLDITPKIVDKRRAVTHRPEAGEVIFEDVHFCYHDDSEESRVTLNADAHGASVAISTGARNGNGGGGGGGGGDVDGVAAALARPRAPVAHKWVLDGLCCRVAAGERVALVGPSGSGKTTLVSLLPRLYDVGEGRILIDGVDVRDYRLSMLRQAIAVVQQESMVFSGTIRDNLKYGRPAANEEEVIEAAKAANAHGFITALPDGYDTRLGENGINLSGGQRQRLSIARALLKDPRILILDEATSALDTESEAMVQAALERLMRGRTCFIIAHRLSTVRGADRILVVDKGRIVESGTHDELLTLDGTYARLVRHQFPTSHLPVATVGMAEVTGLRF
ncbi:MAG TPA: ABC transporter ATP-binding protein [Tepidisphaeraceae bacterium]|nr:ABC transporter ATP-binding protein [Tepidisphaeraceae bacterium]